MMGGKSLNLLTNRKEREKKSDEEGVRWEAIFPHLSLRKREGKKEGGKAELRWIL